MHFQMADKSNAETLLLSVVAAVLVLGTSCDIGISELPAEDQAPKGVPSVMETPYVPHVFVNPLTPKI